MINISKLSDRRVFRHETRLKGGDKVIAMEEVYYMFVSNSFKDFADCTE